MSPRRRILVAEPSPTLTTLIRLTLQSDELELAFVRDGRSALSKARELRPDLIICDAHLPELDGYALTEALRRDPTLSGVIVLLTIADYETPDVERMAHLEVADVLTKPFERYALLERVRALTEDLAPRGGGAALPSPAPALPPARHEPTPRQGEAGQPSAQAIEAIVDARVQALLERALPAMVERLLPDVLERSLRPLVERELYARVPEQLRDKVEPIVWKVIPELAEELIKAEIARLTEEFDA